MLFVNVELNHREAASAESPLNKSIELITNNEGQKLLAEIITTSYVLVLLQNECWKAYEF